MRLLLSLSHELSRPCSYFRSSLRRRSRTASSLLARVENQRIRSMRALRFANQLLLLQSTEFLNSKCLMRRASTTVWQSNRLYSKLWPGSSQRRTRQRMKSYYWISSGWLHSWT
ncbi:uncharacterized protein LOC107625080 isoform X2 [Arachis ipaensis]|uniref:uncharacterized protein LOC107625080 isoform X2 n=1 Tax=Arachis ipaensis TaxID=130454 RepID=UPI0007AF0607|nr:uncharacterized protein LOC107625080 isoform X2 [Arachis ipaensis]XP_029146254.1 uncharacterized protein LOC114924829 isoform X2 [Arachis hypogaea]